MDLFTFNYSFRYSLWLAYFGSFMCMNTRETGDKEKKTGVSLTLFFVQSPSSHLRLRRKTQRPDMTIRTLYEEQYENARVLSSKYRYWRYFKIRYRYRRSAILLESIENNPAQNDVHQPCTNWLFKFITSFVLYSMHVIFITVNIKFYKTCIGFCSCPLEPNIEHSQCTHAIHSDENIPPL